MSTGDADCCASIAEAMPPLSAESVVRSITMAFMFRMIFLAYSGTLVSAKKDDAARSCRGRFRGR
jgi:hypothetical protein